MPETIVPAVDISGYQGRPAADYYLSLYKEGVRLAYVQAWGGQPGGLVGPNKYCEQQLRGFRLAGMQTGIYFWLPPGKDPDVVAAAGLLTTGDELPHISFTVIDIEGSSQPTLAAVGSLVVTLEQLKKPVAFYCRANNWTYGAAFANHPLIEARYVLNSGSAPRTPPYLDWHWASFGGWTQRAGLQYAGTVNKYGVGTDLNVMSLDRLGLVGEEGGDELASTEYTELKSALAEESVKRDKQRAYRVYACDVTAKALSLLTHGRPASAQSTLDEIIQAATTLKRLLDNGAVLL